MQPNLLVLIDFMVQAEWIFGLPRRKEALFAVLRHGRAIARERALAADAPIGRHSRDYCGVALA